MSKKHSAPKRVVLGIGYPDFSGDGTKPTSVRLAGKMEKNSEAWVDIKTIKRMKTVHGSRIRLVAEIL
jgi:hypothetical protein